MEIHAGAGGTESQDWAEMLRRMYIKWCSNKEFKFQIIEWVNTNETPIEDSSEEETEKKKFIDNKDLLTKVALNYLAVQKNDLGFPMNDVCRFHLKNGAEIDDIVVNANVSDVGFKRSFGIMVNYKYELGKIEQNHQEYVNEKKINISSKLKKYV